MKQISTAVGLWYEMNSEHPSGHVAAGPGWWAGEGAQVVTIVRCDA